MNNYEKTQKVDCYLNDHLFPGWKEGQTSAVSRFFEKAEREDHILDLGCGTGVGLEALDREGFMNVFGLEFNKIKAEQARQNSKYAVFTDDMEDMVSVEDNFFDYVYSSHSLEHVRNPIVCLKEIRRVLKDSGKLLVILPYPETSGHNTAISHIGKYDLKLEVEDEGESTAQVFRDAGFKVDAFYQETERESELWLECTVDGSLERKIYDTFLYYDEIDLVNIRMHELDDIVDYFVVIESKYTFSGKKKELHFPTVRDRVSKFNHKIKYLVVEDFPEGLPPFGKENYQRNYFTKEINIKDNDIVLMSDVDEIPRSFDIGNIIKNYTSPILFLHKHHNYYLNMVCIDKVIPGTVLMKGDEITDTSVLDDLRNKRYEINNKILSGWNFSYLGGYEAISKKLGAFAHTEYDNDEYRNTKKILDDIEKGFDLFEGEKTRYVCLPIWSGGVPNYVLNNQDKFAHLIKETSLDYYGRITKKQT